MPKQNLKTSQLLKYWTPVLLWAGAIFAFSSFPTGTASKIVWSDFILKKTAHVIEYAIFTTLLYRAFLAYGMDKNRAAITSVLIAIVYGLSDEYHQTFIAGRTGKIRDVGFDTIGACLAILLMKQKRWAEK